MTGSSSGVGKATAELLHLKGYEVLGLSRHQFPKCEFSHIQVDLADAISRSQITTDQLSHMDVLVLNAGMGELGAVEETPLEQSRALFEVNYWANVELIQKVLPYWRQRGSGTLVVLGSIVTELHFPFKAQYSASKAALTAFLECLQHEILEYGIQIHVLEPGWIRSDFHNRLVPVAPPQSKYAHRFAPFLDYSNDFKTKYPDGKDLAQLILSIIENGGPFRQAVGPDAKAFYRFGRWLPYKVRQWLVQFLTK